MEIQALRERLLEIMVTKSLEFGDFTLTTGLKSNYYIDGKRTTFDPEGAYLVGKLIFELIKDVKVDSIGGMTLGADPIAYAVGLVSFLEGRPIRIFSVRKEPKAHGKRRWIEGNFEPGDRVVVVEDVVTTGGSTLRAIEGVEKEGGTVVKVVCLVNRDQGGRENLQARGYELEAIFHIEEVLQRAKERGGNKASPGAKAPGYKVEGTGRLEK